MHIWVSIYALKEIVEIHRSHNGSMFMGFLDASKAFDKIDCLVLTFCISMCMDRHMYAVLILCV